MRWKASYNSEMEYSTGMFNKEEETKKEVTSLTIITKKQVGLIVDKRQLELLQQ